MSNSRNSARRGRHSQNPDAQNNNNNWKSKGQQAQPRSSQPTKSSASGPDLGEITDSDDFRMYCMKVLPCSKRLAHDWTTCAFAHNGEKARRRDPRKYNYTGIACVDMKETGSCERGDDCPYAHSTFEYWLHPTRYRTQLCKDLGNCKRDTCFFAHRTEELRVPDEKPYISPEQLAIASLSGIRRSMEKERTKGLPMPIQRPQPPDLAFTPFSHAQSEVQSPRAPTYPPPMVRFSAPLADSMLGRSPVGGWVQQPARRSADFGMMMGNHGNVPFSSQRQRADEIALADALAKLSVTLNQSQHGDQGKDDVIQTVHQVLRQALDQKESSLGFELPQHHGNMGGMGFGDGIRADLSAPGDNVSPRSSSDIGSPLPQQMISTDALSSRETSPMHNQRQMDTMSMDPWKLNTRDPLDLNDRMYYQTTNQ